MKIILRQNHAKLGSIGEIVEVKDGYARNFLIPRNIGYPATAGNMRALEEEKRQSVARESREITTMKKVASDLERIQVTLKMKAGEDEKLFGSVTSQMIADALAEQGVKLDKRSVVLEEPIRSLGIYTVDVKLHAEVASKVKVWVVAE